MKRIFSLLLVIIFSTGQVAQAGLRDEINYRLKDIHTKARGIYDTLTTHNWRNTISSMPGRFWTEVNKPRTPIQIYLMSKSSLHPVFNFLYVTNPEWGTAIDQKYNQLSAPMADKWRGLDGSTGTAARFILAEDITRPSILETIGMVTLPLLGAGLVFKGPKVLQAGNLALKATSHTDDILKGSRLLNLGRATELTSSIGSKSYRILQGGSRAIWNSGAVRTWGKYIIAPAGIEVGGNFLYGFSPFKSVAFNTYSDNQGRTNNLLNDISRQQHLLEPGRYNIKNYEAALSDLSQAFPDNTATPGGVKRYLEEKKYSGINSDDKIASNLAEIVKLNSENQKLVSGFNTYEKGFTVLAEINNAVFGSVGDGLNSLGVPFAGDFVKTAGSFTPLTGLSIGASVGANPSQGWRGFADFVVNPVEAGIGLRRGSIVDRTFDYHSNYRNLGEAAGSAFILLGGGRQAKDTLKSANTGIASYLGLGDSKIGSFLSEHKPVISMAVLTLPLATAALWQGGQTGNLGTPAGATAVMALNMFGPSFIKGKIMPSQEFGSSKNIPGSIEVKPDIGLDNVLSLSKRTAEKEGKSIAGGTIERAERPSAYPESSLKLASHREINKFKITSRLLNTKVFDANEHIVRATGEPIPLIPAISLPAFNYNGDNKDHSEYIKKLVGFQRIHQMERKEKITFENNRIINIGSRKEVAPEILQQNFKKYGVSRDAYNEYNFHRNEFKAMGGDFENFVANLAVSERKGLWEAEVEGFKVVEAIHKMERGELLSGPLKKYEAFAAIHIENNRIRRSANEKPLEYDPLSTGLGWMEVKDFISSKNNNPSKTIYDLACSGGKTEETAIVLRFLSENFPKEEILYHTADDKLVNEFRTKPILAGARVNKVEAGTISSRRYPYKEGINVFDTHTLLELASTKYLSRKGWVSYIKGRHLLTDEPQAAMQAADLVKSKKDLFQPLKSRYYKKRNENIYISANALWEITRRVVGAESNRNIPRDELKNNDITSELLKKGIIRNEGYGKIAFKPEIKRKIAQAYKKATYFDKEGTKRYYDYGKDMDSVVDIIAGMLVKKMSKDYYIYKVGEYCIGEAFTGAQRPRTHFGGQGKGALNNLQAQFMAIKHGWDFKSFTEVLMDKTKHAANYVQALEQAKSVSGFSGTGKAYELSFDRLKIPVRQIGKNYDSMVKEQTKSLVKSQPAKQYYTQKTLDGKEIQIQRNKDGFSKDAKEISIAETIKDSVLKEDDAKTSLWLASSNDAKELGAAGKKLIDWQKQTTLDSDFASRRYKTVLPRDIKVNLITYNTVQNIQHISQLSKELQDKFIDMLLADKDKRLPRMDTRSKALEFIEHNPALALEKLKEYGADLDIINYQQQYIKFNEERKNNPGQKRIVPMQGLIEGSNVAAKIMGDKSEAKMFLFGLQPEANVLQAGQRVGIIPSVARRRAPGEYFWLVSLGDHLLTTKERDALARAKTEQEVSNILFEAAGRLQFEINMQNIYKVRETQMSYSEIARNLSNSARKTKWNYKKAEATAVSFDSLFETISSEDVEWLSSIFNKWVIPESRFLNHEGAALFDLAIRLTGLSNEEKTALRNFGFSDINNRLPADGKLSLRQAFEIAEFLYQNELVYFDIETNKMLDAELARVISIGNLVNTFGIQMKPEEISYLLNIAKSDFALYNLVSQKLEEANPGLCGELARQIQPVIKVKNKLSELEGRLNSISLSMFQSQQRSFSGFLSYIYAKFNFLKDKIYFKWYEYKFNKATQLYNKGVTLAGLDKIKGVSAADFILLLTPNLNDITGEELNAVERMDEFLLSDGVKDMVNRDSIPVAEIMKLADGEMSAAEFICAYLKESEIKAYARTILSYENALRKQTLSYIQKNIQDSKDEIFAKNFGINLENGTHLNLAQLRSLSDGKLPDNLLLRIYLSFGISDEGIEDVIVDEEINNIVLKKGTSQEVSEALAELIRPGKLWGMERAVRELQSKYTFDVVNEAVKGYLANLIRGRDYIPEHLDAMREAIVNTAAGLVPLINRGEAINAAATMGLLKTPMAEEDNIMKQVQREEGAEQIQSGSAVKPETAPADVSGLPALALSSTYKDLKVTAAELNSPNLAAVVASLMPFLSSEELERFSLFSHLIKQYGIDADDQSIFRLIELTTDSSKADFETFVTKNIKGDTLRMYLESFVGNSRRYKEALGKQRIYNLAKTEEEKEEYKQDSGLAKDITFFKQRGIDLTKLRRKLGLDELRGLAGGRLYDNLLDELLVTLDGGFAGLKGYLEQVKQEEKAEQIQSEAAVKPEVVSPAATGKIDLPAVVPLSLPMPVDPVLAKKIAGDG